MRISVKWKGRGKVRKLQRNISKLGSHKVEYGYFKEQGKHPEADVNYATLMAFHEKRVKGDFERRPVFEKSLERYGKILRKDIARSMKSYVDSSPFRSQDAHKLLKGIGQTGVEITRFVFGDTSLLASNTPNTIARKGGKNSPMVEFGFLKDALSYKTSVKKKLFTPFS